MKRRLEQGSILTTAMIGLFFVITISIALSTLTVQTLKLANRDRKEAIAFNLAESGAERAARWLKDQTTGVYSITTTDPFGGAVTTTGGTYQVTISTYGPTNTALRMFRILSTGTSTGITDQVELIVRQQSFGMYAYFTDQETSSISSGRIWFASSDRIRGPAHSNSANNTPFQVNWGSVTSPIFEGMVSSAASTIDYSPSRPDVESEFLRIYRSGSRGYQLGLDPIPLPATSDAQKNAAWGGTNGFPTSTAVHIRNNGGVYIQGDAAVVMSVGTGGVQRLVITQGSTVTTVTINPLTGVMTRQVGSGAVTTSTGVSTRVIYCSGNITSLSGTIADNFLSGSGASTAIDARSSYTIATDVSNGKNITVNNLLRHNSQIDFTRSMTDPLNMRAGTLWLIARNVVVASSAPQSMQIDAVILAGSSSYSDGSFYAANHDTRTPTGTLRITGGIIQKARGPVGTISGSNLATGFAKDYYYDSRLAEFPPPYFPITPNYDRISWRRP